MARQPKTARPKTKYRAQHQMKCASCGTMTPKFKLIKVGARVLAFCDPRHVPSQATR